MIPAGRQVKGPFLQRFDLALRSAVPVGFSFFLVLIGQVPFGLSGGAILAPHLALICVFYWAVHRPDLMPAWSVFLLGLFQDLLTGEPLGVGSFTLLFGYGIIVSQRRFLVSFGVPLLWLSFAVTAFIVMAIAWLASIVLMWRLLSPAPQIFQFSMSVAVYPLFAWILARTQQSLIR